MKKALGKGIKAFIPEEYGILKDEAYAELEIEQLKPSPLQPRMKFDDKGIDELAQSIKEAGVLQPIIVVPENGHFVILIGERRWRAARRAGLARVPVLIRNIPKEQQLEFSLVENLQREELNPVEIAQAYKKLTEELGYTQEDVARRVGKERASVTNYLRLFKLPGEILAELQDGKLSMGHAKALLALDDDKSRLALAGKIIKKGLSVREAEFQASRLKKPAPKPRKLDPDLAAVEEELLMILGTKVNIKGTPKKGTVQIFYYSLDELNRIYDLMKGARA